MLALAGTGRGALARMRLPFAVHQALFATSSDDALTTLRPALRDDRKEEEGREREDCLEGILMMARDDD